MSAAHTEILKNHSKENTATTICDILNHSQENFVIEIKSRSGSNFFRKSISKSSLIRRNHKYPAGYPIMNLSMLAAHLCYPVGCEIDDDLKAFLSKV